MVTETTPPAPIASGLPDEVAKRYYWGRWVAGVVVLTLFIWAAQSIYTNPSIDHNAVTKYFFSKPILDGLKTTLILAILAEVLAVGIGTVIALWRMSTNPVLSAIAWFYVWLFRGTPLLVQILILGNFSLFYQNLSIQVPFTDITLHSWDTNSVLTMFVASVLALALNEGAYFSEIARGGIQSVDRGQLEASHALGMGKGLTLWKVVLPQAVRVIIPPAGNDFINLLKMTSLVSVIAGGDLLTQAQNISAANLKTVELLLVASGWYLIIVSIFTVLQTLLERRVARGNARSPLPRKRARASKRKGEAA